jgi:phenylpropionate dioxygenase-like ring-hydroxylating dioxygenase large terminal subunit
VRLLTNDDQRLRPWWHPVPPDGGTVALLGRAWRVDECAAVTEHLGVRWVAIEPPRGPLPDVTDDCDPAFVRVPSPPRTWLVAAGVMADNFCDLGHLPFVHAASFANVDDTVVPRLTADRTAFGFSITYEHTTQRLHSAGMGRRRMELTVTAPFSVVLRLAYLDDDATITTAFLHQPVDADTTTLWAINWRDDIVDGRCTPAETTAFQELVGTEDRAMLETLRHDGLPLDLTAEVHTVADRPTVELRRLLARLL